MNTTYDIFYSWQEWNKKQQEVWAKKPELTLEQRSMLQAMEEPVIPNTFAIYN